MYVTGLTPTRFLNFRAILMVLFVSIRVRNIVLYLLYEDNVDIKRINRAMDEYRFSVGLKNPMSL